jgi:hypothetical protein
MLVATRTGEFVLLDAELAGRVITLGVLLLDPADDVLYLRIRRDVARLTSDETDREMLELLQADLESKASEMGGAALLEWLESSLSNFLRVSDRESVMVERFPAALYRLYRKHVPAEVVEFRTHLPRYTLRAAAGQFGEEREIESEPVAWDEAPPDLRVREGMFVAQVVGHSMEPAIPDGALCVFRTPVGGSRFNRKLLVENFADTEQTGRYTVKIYGRPPRPERAKAGGEDGESQLRDDIDETIVLIPLNPEYPRWEVPREKVRVIAEFVCVLD